MIDEAILQRVLGTAMSTGGEFAEVFVEDSRSNTASLDGGKVEQLSSGRDRGAGLRVVVGDTTGFAHTADLSEAGLLVAAEAAAAAAKSGGGGVREITLERHDSPNPNTVEIAPEDTPKARKVGLLQMADSAARGQDAAIGQVSATVQDMRRRILVANSDGLLTTDDQVRTRFVVRAVAKADTGMQTASKSVGLTVGYELFDIYDVEEMAREAAHKALTKLKARPAPSGSMPVVIGAGSGGVLFHEACGHGLERDAIDKNASVFAGRVGQQVASELVTLVDDANIARQWGAFAIDDEGAPAQRNVLIEKGILRDYMADFLRNRNAGRENTGNGRRETFRHLPLPRMTNTYLEPGDSEAADVIASVDNGIYIAELGGGQVNSASGDFVFGMTEAFMIEGGQVTDPIREGNLIGNGPQCLQDIVAVGNDMKFGWPGTCGKKGQSVPVGMGCPTLAVSSLTIGGTAS